MLTSPCRPFKQHNGHRGQPTAASSSSSFFGNPSSYQYQQESAHLPLTGVPGLAAWAPGAFLPPQSWIPYPFFGHYANYQLNLHHGYGTSISAGLYHDIYSRFGYAAPPVIMPGDADLTSPSASLWFNGGMPSSNPPLPPCTLAEQSMLPVDDSALHTASNSSSTIPVEDLSPVTLPKRRKISSRKRGVILKPTLPKKEKRIVLIGMKNPFTDNILERISKDCPMRALGYSHINSYIKVDLYGPDPKLGLEKGFVRDFRAISSDRPSHSDVPSSPPGMPIADPDPVLFSTDQTEADLDQMVATSVPAMFDPNEGEPLLLSFLQTPTPTPTNVNPLPLNSHRKSIMTTTNLNNKSIPRSPPSLGWQSKLSELDGYLFDFYLVAWCTGRAILPGTNSWLQDIVQMGDTSVCVLHSILALSSIYVLDYRADDRIRRQSNKHYERAVRLLSVALDSRSEYEPGGGQGLIAALSLLTIIDIVSPEHRRPRGQTPRWLEGARTACKLLDATDPGHRYWNTENFQCSHAWVANTILTARAIVVALPMMPLELSNTDNGQFSWLLLQNSEADISKIHGGCGFSPRLLHRITQVTHLSCLLVDDPESIALPNFCKEILSELTTVRQWSELNTEGWASPEALHEYCAAGVEMDEVLMTDLTAEAWRLAVILYALCRFFRLPRRHPEVLRYMTQLASCVRPMPTSGTLFTAQAPFFPVFLLGLLAVRSDHAELANRWFTSVLSAGCRSSVPPVFKALKRISRWLAYNERSSIIPMEADILEGPGSRNSWWEEMVEHVAKTEGVLALV